MELFHFNCKLRSPRAGVAAGVAVHGCCGGERTAHTACAARGLLPCTLLCAILCVWSNIFIAFSMISEDTDAAFSLICGCKVMQHVSVRVSASQFVQSQLRLPPCKMG
jgi:hypothetical protein